MKLCTAFRQWVKRFSDERQQPIAQSVFKHSAQNVHQLQQHTIEVCCENWNDTIVLISMKSCGKSFSTKPNIIKNFAAYMALFSPVNAKF